MSYRLGMYTIKQEVRREARRLASVAWQAELSLDELQEIIKEEYERRRPYAEAVNEAGDGRLRLP